MNVLWLSTGLFKDRYGQQNYEAAFLRASQQIWGNECRISILLLNDIVAEWQSYYSPELKFVCCGNRWRLLSQFRFVLFALIYAIMNRPVLIVCGHMNLSVLCLLIASVFRIKYIILAYGMDVWCRRSRLRSKALSGASLIVSMSSYTASRIREQAPLFNKSILVIPACIDTEMFSPMPKSDYLMGKYNLEGCRVILTVARLSSGEDKGCDRVVRALPEIIKLFPETKYLIVGGGDGAFNIMKLARQLNLQEHVVLTGFVEHADLNLYYNLCDLFIMPSKQEGLGIVFLEALSCAKPVIAGNQDGSREALLDGRLGLLVNPDDISEISRAIAMILNKKPATSVIDGDFLRKSVIQHFGAGHFQGMVAEALAYLRN